MYRADLGYGRPASNLISYSRTKKAAQDFLDAERASGYKAPNGRVEEANIPRDKVLMYYKQSEHFVPEELEVVVSRFALVSK